MFRTGVTAIYENTSSIQHAFFWYTVTFESVGRGFEARYVCTCVFPSSLFLLVLLREFDFYSFSYVCTQAGDNSAPKAGIVHISSQFDVYGCIMITRNIIEMLFNNVIIFMLIRRNLLRFDAL